MKIALIGNGDIAPFYINAFKDFDVEMLICSPSTKIRKIGKTRYLDNYRDKEILAADIVIIATPPSSHYKLLKYFTQKDKKVVVEKPGVISIKQLDDLDKFINSGVYFAYHTAFNPLINKLSALLEDRTITKVIVSYEENVYDYHPKNKWIFNKRIAGGGCLIDSGINILSVLYKFLPELKLTGGKITNKFVPVEDFVKIKLVSENEIPVEINMNWFSVNENRIYYFETDKGHIQVNLATNEIIVDNKNISLLNGIHKIDQENEYRELAKDIINYFDHSKTQINYSATLPIKTILEIYNKI